MTKTERLKKSANLYDEIVEKYPRTTTAMVAQYESGNVYFDLEDNASAEKRYRSFLEKYPDQKDLAALVRLKLGYLQQKKGDSGSAMSEFRAAYEMASAKSKDQAGFELARSLENAGKKEEAIEIYKKLSTSFAQSPWAAEANARLMVLNPPTASTPPPAAPAKEGITPPPVMGGKSPEKPKSEKPKK